MDEQAAAPRQDGKPKPEEALAAELQFTSSPEYLALVRHAMRWFCERAALSEVEESRAVLSVVEAVTNVIRHAYKGNPAGTITLRFSLPPGRLEVEILDRGEHVPASSFRCRNLDEVKPGGLGVHMMNTCMDEVIYEERPGGGSRMVLVKRIEDARPARGGAHG